MLSLALATWRLLGLYQSHFRVGSSPWNAHQIALREDLALSSRMASAQEMREFERKEQRYTRRLELQLEHNNFADEVERLRAKRLEQRRRLEIIQAYDTLRRDIY